MAVEIRRIILEEAEFTAILAGHFGGDEDGKGGSILEFKVIQDQPIDVNIRVQSPDGRQGNYRVDEANALSALTTFCERKKIPIPRKSKKTVKKNEKGYVFDMVMKAELKP